MPGRIIMDSQAGMDSSDVKESRPPELDGSWRQGEQNKSMGVMMDRLAQQAFFDLNDTITKMAEVGRSEESQQANGLPPNTLDTSDESLQRKRLILDFAKEQRDRFTKALVLSDWSRNGTDMARLIDIKVWQDKQRFAHANAKHAVGQIKVDTVGARMPSPNIAAVMELMATGGAAWVPDLGYIPPKRLSPSQLLRTLRDMNVVLATRLNLHEKLPYYMREFSIANGRATFTVRGEFEVDLAVADEDTSSPFYFIDLRFLFSPAPSSIDQRLRGFLEGRVNQALVSSGVQGCYDLLHNFTLTHKINVLKDQGMTLARGDWFDCIKIESLRRNLVVQYWCHKPGPKSWIEIGIAAKSPTASKQGPPNPCLSIRCFQRQVQVDLDIDLDWNDLNLEAYLLQIISKHSASALESLHDRLLQQKKTSKAIATDLLRDDDTNLVNSISIRLDQMRTPVCCQIEPITGQYLLSPYTVATASVLRMLNQDVADPASLLIKLTCGLLQEYIAQDAHLLGWTVVQGLSKPDMRSIFGSDTRQQSFYTCSSAWSPTWALAVTFGLDGTKWWIVQMAVTQDATTKISTKTIVGQQQLKTAYLSGMQSELNQEELLRIEKLAVAQISFSNLAQDLHKSSVPAILKGFPNLTLQSITTGQESGSTFVAIPAFLRLPQLAGKEAWQMWRTWADDIVRLSHLGLEETDGQDSEGVGLIRHELLIRLKKGKMTYLRQHLGRRSSHGMAFNEHGILAIELHTKFGESILGHIRDKLFTIQQLDERVSALQKLGYQCTSVTLQRLSFRYPKESQFAAQIDFGVLDRGSARLKLEPDTNPHMRIRILLEKLLNAGSGGPNFVIWAKLLKNTLPLLATLQRVESPPGTQRGVTARVRSISRYSLQFGGPHPRLVVNITLRTKGEGLQKVIVWQVEDGTTAAAAEKFPDDFKRALSTVWQEKTDLWFGTGKGLIAFPAGISGAIEKLVNVVKRFEIPDSTRPAPPPAVQPVKNNVHEQKPVNTKPATAPKPQSVPPAQMRKQAGTRQDAITLD